MPQILSASGGSTSAFIAAGRALGRTIGRGQGGHGDLEGLGLLQGAGGPVAP